MDNILVDPGLFDNFVDKISENCLKKPAVGMPMVDSILFKNEEGTLRLILNTGDQDVGSVSSIPSSIFLSTYI